MNSQYHVPDYSLLQKSPGESTQKSHWLIKIYAHFLRRIQANLRVIDAPDSLAKEACEAFRKKARTGTTYCDTALWEIHKADFSLKNGHISVAEHARMVQNYLQREFIYHVELLRTLLHEIELGRTPEIFVGFQTEASALSQNMSLFLESDDSGSIKGYLSQLKHFCEKIAHHS